MANGDQTWPTQAQRGGAEGGARPEFGRGSAARWSRDGAVPLNRLEGAVAFGRRPNGEVLRPIEPLPRPKRPKPSGPRRLWPLILAAIGLVLLMALAVFAWSLLHDTPKLPPTEALFVQTRAPAMVFEDLTGAMIASRGKKTGYRVKLAELPPYVPKAFLAAEDRRFYQHGAIDLKGTIRAAFTDLSHHGVVQGGSTISQQIAKTLMLKPEKTFKRKAQEAVLAWELEHRLGKDGVLELYMNRVFYGQGAYGLDAAAQTYFGKPASQLTLAEATLLAALPEAPSRLTRKDDLTAAQARADTILDTMGEEGWINLGQLRFAKANRPKLAPPPPGEGDLGYVLDYAAAEATRIAGPGAPDLVVHLTIDPRLQTVAQDAVRDTLTAEGKAAKASQGALIAMAPDGAICALVGGLDHTISPFDRATQAHRQPGSSFKPFVYATALEQGVKTSDVFVDAPIRIGNWAPTNYEPGYRGPVTVTEALVHSINTVAVRVGQKVGPDKIAVLAHRFGLADIPDHPDLTISLGAKEVTLQELVSGYQVFQNQGVRNPPYLIAAITSTRGDPIFAHQAPADPQPVYDPELAGKMVRMMMGVVERGTGVRANFGRPAAGKTGTSSDWRDAWFVGFTPDWAAGVWIGNDDFSPMNHVQGGSLPAEIWRKFMVEAHKDVPPHSFDWLPQPDAPSAPPPGTAPAAPVTEAADPRNNFYNDLANDFAAAAAGN